ncbi:MAG TPA: hypothetical protein VKQ11_12510 [Candidatus Sulfotelmatobacter sp.]|nr:hypothetical protein [Candidatus Sulfotelmatobacter sp.]
MKPSVTLAAFLIATFCTVTVSAQLASTQGGIAQTTTSPNAYVYVISSPISGTYELDGYSADSTGALTLLSGSPFWKTSKTLLAMANTSHWLFVSDGTYIYSFSIASTGGLKQVSSVNAAQHYGFSGLAGVYLLLDHTGSTLYALAEDGVGDNEFQFFSKNSTTGALSYFGSTGASAWYGYTAFTGNNLYAYGFGCIQDSPADYGFRRGTDGSLTNLNIDPPIPTYPNGDYCPAGGVTADPGSDIAVPLNLETSTQPPSPPVWLAVYTADSSGNLTTNSTYQNMPTAAVGWLDSIVASPAGNLLALGGTSGLQVFHFNGSNPITPYTGLLAVHELSRLAWDTHNHLYGISPSGRLYAFKITTTGYKQASGSPYSIGSPQAITVLSK